MASLIEGIPDAVAMQCFARVPLGMHRVMRAVCKSWRAVLQGRELFHLRKEAGLLEEWLYVTCYEPERVWEAYDPISDCWFVLPLLPTSIKHLSNFATTSVASKLYVIGGGSDDVDPRTGEWDSQIVATDTLWSFDPIRCKWEERAPMLTARCQFACCSVDGKIIVAGGFGNTRRPLASAEMYDPEENKWERIADLNLVFNSACSAVTLDGKMHLLHKGESVGQIYNRSENSWNSFQCVWPRGPMTVIKGELFVVSNEFIHSPTSTRAVPNMWVWPDYLHRIGFSVAGIGSDLYIVGGILGPRPESLEIHALKDVDIWNVDNAPVERRGTSMNFCSGTVLGCAVLSL